MAPCRRVTAIPPEVIELYAFKGNLLVELCNNTSSHLIYELVHQTGGDVREFLQQFKERRAQKTRQLPPSNLTNRRKQQHKHRDQLPPELQKLRLKMKLFAFHENRRPAYFGTYSKTSTVITPRRPFYQDKQQLDYEIDSDDEWEEEEEGEDLGSSDKEEDDDESATEGRKGNAEDDEAPSEEVERLHSV